MPVITIFAEYFCEFYALPPERYLPAMFGRSLHRCALPFVFLLRLFSPDFFIADEDFLRGVGLARKPGNLDDEIAQFHSHHDNRNPLRRLLLMRVSARRVMRIWKRVMEKNGS